MWVKNLVKQLFVLPNTMFRGYLARWHFSLSAREMIGWHDFSTSSHMLHMAPFRRLLAHKLLTS